MAKKLISAALITLGLVSLGTKAETVTISDYYAGVSGDSWTYITTYLTDGIAAGTEFTVTEPWYTGLESLFPASSETGQAIYLEADDIFMYLDIIESITVPAGTYTNVLRMAFLDDNFSANTINVDLGIDPALDYGVTDVNWFDIGVGEIKYLGVMAENGGIDGGYELVSYSSVVPIPATVWLFGSGLIGLIGIAKRKST